MTKAEALRNVMDALSASRALQGSPSQIEIECDGDWLPFSRGWSKSAINNNTQPVFLVVDDGAQWPQLATAQRVLYGGQMVGIDTTGIKGPEETGYWLLPIQGA
jgi:hypothetical protein